MNEYRDESDDEDDDKNDDGDGPYGDGFSFDVGSILGQGEELAKLSGKELRKIIQRYERSADENKKTMKMALMKLAMHLPDAFSAVMRGISRADTDALLSLDGEDRKIAMNLLCLMGSIGFGYVACEIMEKLSFRKDASTWT